MSALYAPDLLPFDGDKMEFTKINPNNAGRTPEHSPPPALSDSEARRRGPRTFDVKMELVETIRMTHLLDHYSDPDVNVMPVLQALDIVVRHLASQRAILVGRELYSMKKTHTLRGGKELCWGYHQAVRKATESLVLNVNETSAVFYSPGPLMQLVVAALRVNDARHIRGLSERQLKSLSYALRKVEVVPTHRTDRPRAIFGVSAEPADRLIVVIKGEEMTVEQYYDMKYKRKLRFPQLPCVNVGSKRPGKETWLPIELCDISPGQHCANADDLDSPEITKITALQPNIRMKNILDHVKQANFRDDPYLGTFGMRVDLQMKVTNARVLEPPCVQYQNTSERPVNGEWSLKDKKFVKGVVISNWGVVVLAEVSEREVFKFLRMLCDVGHQRGVSFENIDPVFVHQNDHREVDVEKLMRTCFDRVAESGTPEMMLVVLPETRSSLYGPVKVVSDTILGVPCQCVASKNLRKANAAFCANVCLKLTMRLGGKTAVLGDPLPLLSSSPTILIGADVEHPRPGMGNQPSLAAVVASMDAFSSQYAARVGVQKASSDIHALPHMLRELFLSYFDRTKRRPEHVIYYRDGVGEGEYFDILQGEIRALRKAFKMISKGYNPPITFIVANKRHHTRAFPVDRHDADRRGNVKPGTVIDTDIVDPHRFDFFMFGHSSLQGTSKPCHYTVLYDENNLSAESIHRLTYDLGYTFSRSTHAVSVAAPVYYANEAAAHARNYLFGAPSSDNTEGSSFRFAKVHKNLLNGMYFI
ncbi:Argonaute5 [Phytophthora megakarya]|uniref:Argonaute5 n=1 Tax=Phytophthora megakarya TaxID=4795 RepID=A0A225X1G2_9STRA|nr:Argonaute5 [Phytophthora megakarya]